MFTKLKQLAAQQNIVYRAADGSLIKVNKNKKFNENQIVIKVIT